MTLARVAIDTILCPSHVVSGVVDSELRVSKDAATRDLDVIPCKVGIMRGDFGIASQTCKQVVLKPFSEALREGHDQ